MRLSIRWTDCEQSHQMHCSRKHSRQNLRQPLLITLSILYTSRSLVTSTTCDDSSGPDEATDQAHSMRHSTDARPYNISGSATMLEFVTPDSRVRVVLSLRSGLVLSRVREVIVVTWNMRESQHPSSTRSWSRAGRLWDHHSSNFDVHRHLTSTLRS